MFSNQGPFTLFPRFFCCRCFWVSAMIDAISSLIQFRNAVYELFQFAADAAMNLLDALVSFDANRVIELSLSPHFERQHHSVARAIQDHRCGRNNAHPQDLNESVSQLIVQQLPQRDASACHFFALDVTAIKKPYAKKWLEKQMVHTHNPTPGQKPIAVGYHLSCLGSLSTENSWCLPFPLQPVPEQKSQISCGLDQVEQVAKFYHDKPCIVAADAKYATRQAIYQAHRWQQQVLLTRLGENRVFYRRRPSKQPMSKKPKRYGSPFKLKDRDTQFTANVCHHMPHITTTGKTWQVHIERFDDLIMKGKRGQVMYDKPVSVFRLTVTDDQGKSIYQNPLWLLGIGKVTTEIHLQLIFMGYHLRFNIEHWFRAAKRHLLLDGFQTSECQHEHDWLLFPVLATHLLYHARHLAMDCLRPWESKVKTDSLSLSQVKRSMGKILNLTGSPAAAPKTRGVPKGRDRGCKNKHLRPDVPIQFKSKPSSFEGQIVIKLKTDSLEHLDDVELQAQNLPQSGAHIKSAIKEFLVSEQVLKKAA